MESDRAGDTPQATQTTDAEQVQRLTALVEQLTTLHLQQSELLRASGFLDVREERPLPPAPPGLLEEWSIEAMADRLFDGDLLLARRYHAQIRVAAYNAQLRKRAAQEAAQQAEQTPTPAPKPRKPRGRPPKA